MVLTFRINGVSNGAMNKHHPDAEKIRALGGPTEVARLLRLEKFGPQRVSNWMRRGIPLRVQVDNPDLFGAPSPQNLSHDAAPIRVANRKDAVRDANDGDDVLRAGRSK